MVPYKPPIAVWDAPVADYLKSLKFSDYLVTLVLHAVSLSPDPTTMTVAQAVRAVANHVSSAGQYSDTAFIVPMYGGGEIPQSFCR